VSLFRHVVVLVSDLSIVVVLVSDLPIGIRAMVIILELDRA
jgi:hypothetical protein